MKFAVKILLLLFIAFLATPTVVSIVKKDCNTSFFYGMSEEELVHKEVKAAFKFSQDFTLVNLSNCTSSLILSENLSKHDKVSASIFIPPPDFT